MPYAVSPVDPPTPHSATRPGDTVAAMVQTAYGAPDVMRPGTHVLPELGATDVLVEVQAAAVDRGTWHIMTGTPTMTRPVFGLRRPGPKYRIPGRDLAGIVLATGAEVTDLRPGDRVHGTADGSIAGAVVTGRHRLAVLPADVSFEQGAAVPVSGLTAFQAVVEAAAVAPGSTVLVTGASGGVGTFAVQLAAAVGAEVTASCRAGAAEVVASLGARRVVDRTTSDPYDVDGAYDVVIDIAGRPSVTRLRRALRRGGTAVVVGGEGGTRLVGGMSRQLRAVVVSAIVPERLTMLVADESGEDLARLDERITAGDVRPVIDSVFPAVDLRAALARLESGDVVGKVVVSVAGSLPDGPS